MSKTKKDNKVKENANTAPVTETPVSDEAELSLNEKVNFAEQNKELTAKNKALMAEIEKIKSQQKQLMLATKLNTIKELEIQNQENYKYANQKIIKDLVHALLNFQRALNFKTANDEVEKFLIGFKFIYTELIKALEKEGLKEINAKVGEEFNSHKHEAIEIINTNDSNKNLKDNTIVEVVANGYELHNRIISTVKVKVFQTETKLETKKN